MAEPPVAAPMLEQSNHWTERTEYLRTVTKWSIVAIAVAVSLAVGLSPLTGIGSLRPGARLAIAVAAALVGVAAMGWSFLAAVEVLKVRMIDLRAIADSIQFTSLRSELDRVLKPRLPLGVDGIRQLVGKFYRVRRLVENYQFKPGFTPTEDERNEINAFPQLRQAVDRLLEVAGFVLVQDLFERFWKRLAKAGVVTATAFVVFAWAANPPRGDDAGGKGPVDMTQVSASEPQGDATPCAAPSGCCGGSAACAPPSTPTQAIPPDCVTMLVADGKATCVEGGGSPETDERMGRTFALLRPGSFDLARVIAEAIAELARSGRPASDQVVARNVAQRINVSFSDEFGKPLASRLFEHAAVAMPDQLNPVEPGNPTLNVWFSMAPAVSNVGEIRYQSFDASPFDTESAEINHIDAWGPKLAALSNHAVENRCRIEIVGYADRRGTASYNLYLAMQRASALERWIMASTTLPRRNVSVYATGAFGLGCETDQPLDLACNRHVEVTEFCGVGVTN